MLDHWSDTFHRIFDVVLGPIGILLNLSLLVIIGKYTPDSLKTYSAIIWITTLCDFITSLSQIVVTARPIPQDSEILIMAQGVCELFSDNLERRAKFCMFWYALYIQITLLNFIMLLISVVYRLLIITQPFDHFDRKRVHFVVFSYSVLHFWYFMWVFYLTMHPMSEINEAVLKIRPELIGSDWTYYAVLYLNSPSLIVMKALPIHLPWIVIVIFIICRIIVQKFFRGFQFSDNLKKLHKSIMKVLFVQTIGLTINIISTACYVLVSQSESLNVYFFENLMTMPIGLMMAVNPIVTIYFVTPYRRGFQSWFSTGSARKLTTIVSMIPTQHNISY